MSIYSPFEDTLTNSERSEFNYIDDSTSNVVCRKYVDNSVSD